MPRPTRPAVRPIAAALVLAALVTSGAACSSSAKAASQPSDTTAAKTSPSTNSSGPNPCEIVTAAEVQTILGSAATPKGPEDKNRGTECTWNNGGGSVLVQVFHGKEFYDPSLQAPKAKKVSGLGDDAYFDDFGTTRAAVGFLKGDTAVFVDGFAISSSAAVLAAAKDAATKV